MKPRSELIFDHAIKHVTPFSTTLGHSWVVVPDGPTRCYGWPNFSRRFRQWLAHGFTHAHALESAMNMLAAHARFSQFPRGEIFTRIGWRGGEAPPPAPPRRRLLPPHRFLAAPTLRDFPISAWKRAHRRGTPNPPNANPRILR